MIAFLIFSACTEDKIEDTATPYNEGPIIVHEQPDARLVSGDSIELGLFVEDSDGLAEVSVYHRKLGDLYWDETVVHDSGNETSLELTAALTALQEPGVEYYFKATDNGLPASFRFYPERGPETPLMLEVSPQSLPLPYETSFEPNATGGTLLDMNWWTPSDARDTFAFRMVNTTSNNGQYSVYHPSGSSSSEISDWLISPPLDFSQNDGVMVGWFEKGANISEATIHSLYVSTGSRLPEDGDFVKVVDLEPPVGISWERHNFIDLSQYAGEPLVYVAWRWEGSLADEWWLDDISIKSLGPDFDMSFSVDPISLSPGSNASLTVNLENMTNGGSEPLELTVAFPDSGATAPSSSFSLDPIAAFDLEEVQIPFAVSETIDPNQKIDVELNLTDGVEFWNLASDIQIGQPSVATVDLDIFEATTVSLTLGVGDPESPQWTDSFFTGYLEAGLHSLTHDITDQFAYLPATPESRWFVRVESDSMATFNGFSLVYGGETLSNTQSDFSYGGNPHVAMIPPPPIPSLYWTSPNSLQPGQSNVSFSVTLRNLGEASQGPLTGELLSDSSALTVQNGEALSIPGIWETDEIVTIYGPILSIDSTHTTSMPVSMTLNLTDGVDSWVVPISLDSPWPVLSVTGIVIDDDANFMLDPGETSDIEVYVTNVGGLNASGAVNAVLSAIGPNASLVSIDDDSAYYGFMNVGDVEDKSFELSINGGAVGDVIDFQMDMSDNQSTFQDTFQIVLGETPWFSLTPFPDSAEDSLDPNTPDLVSVEYRIIGDQFNLRLTASNPIDISTAFFEIWGESGGSDYLWYRWVLQSGVATMQGYHPTANFQDIGTLQAAFPADDTVVLSWSLADMGLNIDTLSFGLAAGWCGPPSYFCDHYPNGWGYPYISFDSSDWFTATW